jgi:hypothetical protein
MNFTVSYLIILARAGGLSLLNNNISRLRQDKGRTIFLNNQKKSYFSFILFLVA